MKHLKAWQFCRQLSEVMASKGVPGRALPKKPKRKRLRKKLTKRFFSDFKEGSGEEINKAFMDSLVYGRGEVLVSEDGIKHVPFEPKFS